MEKNLFEEQEKGHVENIISKAVSTLLGVIGMEGDPFEDGEFNKLLIRHNLTQGDVMPIIKRVQEKLKEEQEQKRIEYERARARKQN